MALGLSKKKYHSHSLRRGGATRLLFALVDVDAIMSIERWASLKTCRGYLKIGEALLGQVRTSMTVQAELMWAAFVDECIQSYT